METIKDAIFKMVADSISDPVNNCVHVLHHYSGVHDITMRRGIKAVQTPKHLRRKADRR